MERWVECIHCYAGLLVPLLALWAISCLYAARSGCQCHATQIIYLATMLVVAGLTVRTVTANDGCWLVHTASLGVLIVVGVMKRPAEETTAFAGESILVD